MDISNILRDTSSVDKDVDAAVVIHYILHSLPDSLSIAHIDAIEANIHSSLLTKLSSGFVAQFLLDVNDGDASTAHFCECLRHVVAETTAAATHRRQHADSHSD